MKPAGPAAATGDALADGAAGMADALADEPDGDEGAVAGSEAGVEHAARSPAHAAAASTRPSLMRSPTTSPWREATPVVTMKPQQNSDLGYCFDMVAIPVEVTWCPTGCGLT